MTEFDRNKNTSDWCVSRAEGKDFSAFTGINWLFLLYFAIYHEVKANYYYYYYFICILFKANNKSGVKTNHACSSVELWTNILITPALHPSHLANQDVSYPADDEAPIQAPSL